VSTGIERKLTTILAADVEGYSRLMEADEVAAMAALQDCRAVFARFIERHRGRIANTAGDGLIADFPSVVEAVQCAVEVQREFAARNRQRDQARAMRFRIGLHLGDVMVDQGDLFGEGVNMAARLQSMAEPGGVLISQAVYDQVHAKLAVGYEPLGERRPKNLAREVSVYRLVLDESPPAGAGPGRTLAPAAADAGLRGRVIGHAQRLGILWAALAAVNLFTSDDFWAIWPGIVIVVFLGLEAAPLLARGWLDAPLARLAVIVAGLALVNLASRSGEPWFLWPAGALVVAYLLRRAWRRAG
jgi:adenylate cyclase